MGNNTTYLDDWEPEIVYCRAVKCIRNEGSGKCRIARADDKISVNEEGRCIQYFCG